MRIFQSVIHSLFGVLLAASLSDSAVAQPTQTLAWKQGQTWRYQGVDITFQHQDIGTVVKSVVRVQDDGFVTNINGVEEFVKPSGAHVRAMPDGSGTFDYFPIRLPMAQGVSWKSLYHYRGGQTGAMANEDLTCNVASNEDIIVPAGRFETVRIECNGRWSAGRYSDRVTRTYWYSPSLQWFAKYSSEFMDRGKSPVPIRREWSLLESSVRETPLIDRAQ